MGDSAWSMGLWHGHSIEPRRILAASRRRRRLSLLLAIITFGVSSFVFERFQREPFSALEHKIALQEALIAEYRNKLNGATPGEAAIEIEKLTKMLANAQASLNEVKTQAASVDG